MARVPSPVKPGHLSSERKGWLIAKGVAEGTMMDFYVETHWTEVRK